MQNVMRETHSPNTVVVCVLLLSDKNEEIKEDNIGEGKEKDAQAARFFIIALKTWTCLLILQ